MKKRTLLVVGVSVVVILIAHQVYLHTSNLQNERAWYIASLHYDCSAKVISIVRPGRALIHVTDGIMNDSVEWKLKPQVQSHQLLHFAIAKDSLYDIRVPEEVAKGDSIRLNSDKDQMTIFRSGKIYKNTSILEHLRATFY